MAKKPIRFKENEERCLVLLNPSEIKHPVQTRENGMIWVEIDFIDNTYESYFHLTEIEINEKETTMQVQLENRLISILIFVSEAGINTKYVYKHKNNSL